MAERRLRAVLDSLSLSLRRPEKLRIQKWYTVYKDHISLEDYEIHDGMGLELYCKRPTAAILFLAARPLLAYAHRWTPQPARLAL